MSDTNNPQTVIRRGRSESETRTETKPKGKTSLVSKAAPEAKPRVREFQRRYGKRFLTIRGKSIVADYLPDDTVTMYVIEDSTKGLLPVIKGVHRDKSRDLAKQIASLIEAFEGIAAHGGELCIDISSNAK